MNINLGIFVGRIFIKSIVFVGLEIRDFYFFLIIIIVVFDFDNFRFVGFLFFLEGKYDFLVF